MSNYLRNLISEGEHQKQDFKFEIADAPKIARSLAAFANTSGGRLLVGVKDNGSIAGVRSDEEIHMIEAAAQLYCRPKVFFTLENWQLEGKQVLLIEIPKTIKKLHKAPDNQGIYKVYIRQHDQNLLADPVYLKYLKREQKGYVPVLNFNRAEETIFKHIKNHARITMNQCVEITGKNYHECEDILVSMMQMKLIKIHHNEHENWFEASEFENQETNSLLLPQ